MSFLLQSYCFFFLFEGVVVNPDKELSHTCLLTSSLLQWVGGRGKARKVVGWNKKCFIVEGKVKEMRKKQDQKSDGKPTSHNLSWVDWCPASSQTKDA